MKARGAVCRTSVSASNTWLVKTRLMSELLGNRLKV
jgi:hypothetical protein